MLNIKVSFFIPIIAFFPIAVVARSPQIIAHRGGTGDAPENTEYAIQKAINNGADAIWITLQFSKDGEIVLYRPTELSALTNLKGQVSAYSVHELKKADAAHKFSPPGYPLRGKGITIPTLDEVLKKWPTTFFTLTLNPLMLNLLN